MPTPLVVPFAPAMLAMMPPVPLPPTLVFTPSPFTVKDPVVFCRMMPLLPPFAETLLSANVPPVPLRFTAVPMDVDTLTSLTLTPPTAAPLNPVDAPLPMVRPRTVELAPSVTVPPTPVIVPLALFIAGSAALPLGGVSPVIVTRLAEASWPMSFWPVRGVTAAAYVVALS